LEGSADGGVRGPEFVSGKELYIQVSSVAPQHLEEFFVEEQSWLVCQ